MKDMYLILAEGQVVQGIEIAYNSDDALVKASRLTEENKGREYMIFKTFKRMKKELPFSIGDEVVACCDDLICEIIAIASGIQNGCCRVAVRNIDDPLCVCNSHPVTNAKPDGSLLYASDLKLVRKSNPVDMVFRNILGLKVPKDNL